VLINLLEPVLYVVERLLVCAIVNQDDPHRALVVSLSDRSKSLLPGRVPYLQLNPLVIDVDLLYLEVDAYRKTSTKLHRIVHF
jgi:hypothetical protein